jgi:hypothetical protein
MRTVIFIPLICFFSVVCAQQTNEFPHKVGIKTNINLSTILGSELQAPRPKFGYTAGPYLIFNPENRWSLYTEAVGSFRGSKFKNGDTGYSRIATFYVDACILPLYNVPNSNKAISFGPYTSYLGLSSLFIGTKKKPEINDIGFKDYDIGIASYYHINGETVTLQIGVKHALINANNDVNFVGYYPKTGNGGMIRSLSFEIGMAF